MKSYQLSRTITLVEHIYHANNRICHDYAVLFRLNNIQKFVGYVRSMNIDLKHIDYAEFISAWKADKKTPEWLNNK